MTDLQITVAVTGPTGLVGTRLCTHMQSQGARVFPLRRGDSPAEATWNVHTGAIKTPAKIDTLVHLAGRNVAARWTTRVKKELWDSRVPATEKLCQHLASLPADQRPSTLISASAVGIYGDRGDEVLTEDSPLAPQGSSLLADIGRGWEAATRPAADAGIRVVNLRIGVVLASNGGALAKLATPVKLGLGGPVGSGSQFLPWISLTDTCRLILHCLTDDSARGIINAVGPAPARQRDFIRTLGHVLHRPTIFPLPAFIVRAAFGQMGHEALLSSLRVVPTRLPPGFEFQHKTLEEAIRAELSS